MTDSSLTTITAKPAPEETQSCWSCGTMRAVHFCEACGKVQPPAPVDYFTFFGLPRKLNLDVAALEKDFYELSRKLHPDLNARAGSQEQEWSLQQSSLLNDAHRTLERSDQAHPVSLETGRRGTGRAVEDCDRAGALHRGNEEADRAAGFAGRSLRVEHAARRTAHAEKDGRGRSRPDRRNRPAETRTRREAGSAVCASCRVTGRCGME